jgi:hypothetical protein
MTLGLSEGTKLGIVLGPVLGGALGTDDGTHDGDSVGKADGRVLGCSVREDGGIEVQIVIELMAMGPFILMSMRLAFGKSS